MNRKPYPQYRPSGIEWLGEIPKGWSEKRLRFHMKINPAKSELKGIAGYTSVSFIPMEAVGEYGGLCLDHTNNLQELINGYTYFTNGDVLVAKITPCFENGKGAIAGGLSNGIGFGSTELHVLRPADNLDKCYLFYLTNSHAFRNMGVAYMYGAGGQKRVPDDFIKNLRHPIPPLNEQRAIASFLDRETDKIDALIARKERQIELLKEKRTALISHAVTKGLDPNVKMKDSGIEWLGEVPEHWEVYRAKVLFQEINERSTTGEEELLTVSHRTGVTRRSEKTVTMFMAESLKDYKKCELGDLVINTMWAWMGALGFTSEAGIVSPSYNVYRLRSKEYEPLFYDYLFRTKRFISEIICHSKGVWTSRLRLYPEKFFEIRIPCPPFTEQCKIVYALRKETGGYNALNMKIERSIERLREYRAALISAAVTGKIDVREEASRERHQAVPSG